MATFPALAHKPVKAKRSINMRISDLISALVEAQAIHGDVPVLVKGEHNEFIKAGAVYCTHVEDLKEYYVQLEHEDDVESYRHGIYDAVTIE